MTACKKQPSTEKEFQPAWQAYKYLLCGKMYAYIGIDDRNGRTYCHFETGPRLQRYAAQQIWGHRARLLHEQAALEAQYILMVLVPQEVLTDIVHASYKLVRSSLSKKVQQEILKK